MEKNWTQNSEGIIKKLSGDKPSATSLIRSSSAKTANIITSPINLPHVRTNTPCWSRHSQCHVWTHSKCLVHQIHELRSSCVFHPSPKHPNLRLAHPSTHPSIHPCAQAKAVMSGKTGSYMYMAPEMFNAQEYTEKVDVFSFGVCMYELLHKVRMHAWQRCVFCRPLRFHWCAT